MKITFFVLCLLAATAAFGQSAPVIYNVPQPLHMFENPQHASQHELAQPQNLLADLSYSYAKGERPLWEFGPVSQPTPLGDVARAYRKEHASAKKATIVLEKYVATKTK